MIYCHGQNFDLKVAFKGRSGSQNNTGVHPLRIVNLNPVIIVGWTVNQLLILNYNPLLSADQPGAKPGSGV